MKLFLPPYYTFFVPNCADIIYVWSLVRCLDLAPGVALGRVAEEGGDVHHAHLAGQANESVDILNEGTPFLE